MKKSDGSYTYFIPDVAYHFNKWERGFKRVINEHGSDHHSTITRVRAGLQALKVGIPETYPEYVLHQMITVMKGGEKTGAKNAHRSLPSAPSLPSGLRSSNR